MDVKKQLEIIKRGAVEIISEKELADKLHKAQVEKRPLNIKAGFDPSAPDIHVGHTVLLRKLRDFQDAGHTVYFLIGDFTGRIGDPSGQSVMRRQLTKAEVMENAKTYEKQIFKILDKDKTKIVFNSQWFDRMSLADIVKLASHSTVAQMLARADFKERFEKNIDISILEFMYPLLQAYDSVMLKADVEIGGTDQKFNLLKGRELQKDYGQDQQVVIMMPLLVGTDGVEKMSKSLGNYIGINEPAKDIFGKIMSVNDETMFVYYELLTDVALDKIQNMKKEAREDRVNPKNLKLNLAAIITEQYHGKDASEKAKEEFESVFKDKGLPKDIKEFKISADIIANEKVWVIDLMKASGLVKTGSEARRLIEQGGVTVNGEKISDVDLKLSVNTIDGTIIKAGKRQFIKVKVK